MLLSRNHVNVFKKNRMMSSYMLKKKENHSEIGHRQMLVKLTTLAISQERGLNKNLFLGFGVQLVAHIDKRYFLNGGSRLSLGAHGGRAAYPARRKQRSQPQLALKAESLRKF